MDVAHNRMGKKIMKMTFKETVIELLENLDRIIAILEWDQETHWLTLIQNTKQDLDEEKFSLAIQRLLGIYGGMGSFNDLVIGQSMVNGKFSWKDGAKEKNEELSQLRSTAYQLARELREQI